MKGLLTLEGLAIPMIRRDDVTICDFVRRCVWPLPRQEAGPMEVGGCVQGRLGQLGEASIIHLPSGEKQMLVHGIAVLISGTSRGPVSAATSS